ncbi:MAG: hypothetical protein CME61_02665 [Halobacteriovoraceae bacterium]|nr:hypothetical protein [Halobacteriovoraceae bacterium]
MSLLMCTITIIIQIFLTIDLTGTRQEDTPTISPTLPSIGIHGFDIEYLSLTGIMVLGFMKAILTSFITVIFIVTVTLIDVTTSLLTDGLMNQWNIMTTTNVI